jgi:hypothetical protein
MSVPLPPNACHGIGDVSRTSVSLWLLSAPHIHTGQQVPAWNLVLLLAASTTSTTTQLSGRQQLLRRLGGGFS